MCIILHDAALFDSNEVKTEKDGEKSSTVEEFHNLGTLLHILHPMNLFFFIT